MITNTSRFPPKHSRMCTRSRSKTCKEHKQTLLIDRKRIRSGILAQTTVARPSAIPIVTPAASRFEPIATCRLCISRKPIYRPVCFVRSRETVCLFSLRQEHEVLGKVGPQTGPLELLRSGSSNIPSHLSFTVKLRTQKVPPRSKRYSWWRCC